MDRYERINTLHRLLRTARQPVSLQKLMDEMHCARATVFRDIAFMRDALGAPIEAINEPPGYRYVSGEAERFELPGLWLSSEELHALLAAHQLLSHTGHGVLDEALEPIRSRIDALLSEQTGGKRFPVERIRVITSGTRTLDETAFRMVASSVLERRRLHFAYKARSTEQPTHRKVSPQRLTHYRNNWYLDALDHDKAALRSFSLDRIASPVLQNEAAQDVPETELNLHLASSYGIFSGAPKFWATILFSEHAARWAAEERWHSQQQGQRLSDGRYELRIPYSNSRELLMDILRYGTDATIVEPASLRAEMKIMLDLARANYS